jgi:FixJ family two-component response regulator
MQRWRPVAHVAITDRKSSRQIVLELQRQGWLVFEHPDGVALLAALAEVIDGRGWQPQLIVADVRSHGCSGRTIAAGLHELGITTPVILIATPSDPIPTRDQLWVVDSDSASRRVPDLARRWAPVRVLDREPARALA